MDSDRDFLARFRAGTLAPDEWTHEAQLRVAFLELRDHGYASGLQRIRRGIARLAGRSARSHETATLAWARLVGAALAAASHPDFAAFKAAHPELLTAQRLLRHYSPERLGSERARREFVLPDREPLPVC